MTLMNMYEKKGLNNTDNQSITFEDLGNRKTFLHNSFSFFLVTIEENCVCT
jgi:hypothetical protein